VGDGGGATTMMTLKANNDEG